MYQCSLEGGVCILCYHASVTVLVIKLPEFILIYFAFGDRLTDTAEYLLFVYLCQFTRLIHSHNELFALFGIGSYHRITTVIGIGKELVYTPEVTYGDIA